MIGDILNVLCNLCVLLGTLLVLTGIFAAFNEPFTIGWLIAWAVFLMWIFSNKGIYLLVSALFAIAGSISGVGYGFDGSVKDKSDGNSQK